MKIVKMKGKTLAAGDVVRFETRSVDNAECVIQTKQVEGTVVFVHPKGRFVTVEYGPGLRENVYDLKMDKRGLASSVPDAVIRITEEERSVTHSGYSYDQFTEEEKKKMRDMYQLGVPVTRIASRLGRWSNAVSAYLIKIGLKTKHPRINGFTEEEKQKITQLRAQGKTQSQIAKEIGRSASGVQKCLMKAREGEKQA